MDNAMGMSFTNRGSGGSASIRNLRNEGGSFNAFVDIPPEEPVVLGGSILFSGLSTSNLSIANDEDFRMGSGDFTIEWFQYQTDSSPFPRVFSIGTYPGNSISVSIEGGVFYFWANGSPISFGSAGSYKNQWVHFAISRSGTNLRVFKNGTQLGNATSNTTNFTNSVNLLRIGNESTVSNGSSFGGNITNFRWIKGSSIYTSNFTTPTQPLSSISGTKLLLRSIDAGTLVADSSGLNKTVTNNNTSFSVLTPFSS